MKNSLDNQRHEVRYWPLYRKPEANERAFPKYFLAGCFGFLVLCIVLSICIGDKL